MIPFGSSSSTQPRQHEDDDQRRAANTAAQAGQQSPLTRAGLSKSDATTLFPDTEWGTGIATEELNILALLRLGRNFDTGRSSFDWTTGKPALQFAKRCVQRKLTPNHSSS